MHTSFQNKKAIVLGAGGFIGSHLVTRLKKMNAYVVGVDLKYPDFSESDADEFTIADLRNQTFVNEILTTQSFDFVFQLAADMGGAGFIFTGENDADVMHNSATINLNVLDALHKNHFKGTIFYSSSACIYPEHNQMDPENPVCTESSAYPANPDSEYGWEKLFSERLYASYYRNYGIESRVARFHNIYGPEGTFQGGREKAPAAICRKVATAENNSSIEIWGDGKQTRSFLYIDDCVDAVLMLTLSNYRQPINIGSEEMISINNLAQMVIGISEKNLSIKNIPGPQGVRGRCSDNRIIENTLNWKPKVHLKQGIEKTYEWISRQIK